MKLLRLFYILFACMQCVLSQANVAHQDVRQALGMNPIPVERRLNELDGLSHHHATGIVQDKEGCIWVGTWNGICRFDGRRFVTFKPQPGDGSTMGVNRIKEIRIKGDKIYCNVEFNCFIYDIRQGKFVDAHKPWAEVVSEEGLLHQDTKHLRSKEGVMWNIDSLGVRMMYHRPCYVKRLLWQPGCQVRTLFRDKDGLIWVCSRDDRSVRFYDAKMQLLGFLGADGMLHQEKTRFLSAVYTICQTTDGTLWLGCKPGGLMRLYKIGIGKYKVQQIKNEINGSTVGKEVYAIQQDRWGRLWVGTMDHGLFCIVHPASKEAKVQYVPYTMQEIAGKYKSLRTMLITRHDELLLGTTQGLFVAQLGKAIPNSLSFVLHQREGDRVSSLSNSSIMYMLQDAKQRLFVCTEGGGVNFIEKEPRLINPHLDFVHFNRQDLMDDCIASAFTYGNFMWFVGTNDLSGANLANHLFLYFDHKNWNESLLFSDAVPLWLGRGCWLFGVMDGLVVIDMDALFRCSKAPRIVLTRVLIENNELREAVSACDTIRLDETQRNLSVDFAALDYKHSTSLQYRFRLDNGDWINLEHNNTVTLLNLTPGTHHLCLESKLFSGYWANNVKQITIIVKPTIWQTTFAKVLYVVFTLLIIGLVWHVVKVIRSLRTKQKRLLDSYLDLLEQYDQSKQIKLATEEKKQQPSTEEILPREQTTTETEAASNDMQLTEEDKLFMQKVVEYVEQNMDNSDMSVVSLSESLGMSKSKLNRKLKSLLGITPKEFITKARMNRAVSMLEHTQLSVKEIAYDCGFSDQNYFGKSFRSVYGVSPSEYRQEKVGCEPKLPNV